MTILPLHCFDSPDNFIDIYFVIGDSEYLVFLYKYLVNFTVVFFYLLNAFIRAKLKTVKAARLIGCN
jgi:hypothetical protein